MSTVQCTEFDEQAEELALGMVEEPRRSILLAHAASCPRCQSLLAGFGSVVDRLLLLAPQVEPPAGFENRALSRMGAAVPGSAPGRRVPVWAAAVVAVLLATAGFLTARAVDHSASSPAASAEIVSAAGGHVGSIALVAEPRPFVLVSVTAPRPGSGVRHCELQRPDGEWVEVGTWDIADLAKGVWAVGIDAALLDSTAMRVTKDDGTVMATATFG
jgi:hypothetical protein